MLDNTVWDIPATVIAEHRANYYAKLDYPTDKKAYNKQFKEEVKFVLEDSDELIDWARNNMDWSDVEFCAVKVAHKDREPNYQDDWVNGALAEVIEK